MKKIRIILLILCLVLVITGCNNKTKKNASSAICTRNVFASDANKNIEIKYIISYNKDGYIKTLKTIEKLKCDKKDILKNYEAVYNGIHANYKGLKYYKGKVENENNTVTNTTTINYEKIDINKLLKIEGSNNKVKVENGKIKFSDWKKVYKEYGTTCK